MGFAESLGVIINMKDPHSAEDAQYEDWLRQDPENRCFSQPILRASPLQSATRFAPRLRSYWAKYPGQTGTALRELAAELLWRLAASQPGATQASHRSLTAAMAREAAAWGKR
jgi:chromosome partitioning protein